MSLCLLDKSLHIHVYFSTFSRDQRRCFFSIAGVQFFFFSRDAGDFLCRILQFSRPFGLYLSSNTIICISLDRYFAIVQPLKLADARRRGRVMLLCAWLVAVISSIPQVRLESIPLHYHCTYF